jgi:transposase-like protein
MVIVKKRVKSQLREIELEVPRDLKGEFEPVIVKKHQWTISSELEDMIVSLFARGMSNLEGRKEVLGIWVGVASMLFVILGVMFISTGLTLFSIRGTIARP